MNAIVNGYYKALDITKETPEKKDSASA